MADPYLQITGGGGGGGAPGHPDPEIRRGGRSPKQFFWLFGPQFGLKIRGGVPPLDLPLLYTKWAVDNTIQ